MRAGKRGYALMWALCAAGFALLLALLSGSHHPINAQQPTPLPATATPVCEGTLPTRMVLQERARVAYSDPSPLNVRASAGTSGDILGEIPAGGVFFVLDGPICTNRYTWYLVEYHSTTNQLEGWAAEGDAANGYFVEPFPLGR